MSDIRVMLSELRQSTVTPAVLRALDMLVPGEWVDVTSLEDAVRTYLEVTDPAEVARITERAAALWSAKPHYARAVRIFQAVDTADRLTSAAIVANQAGRAISLLGVLSRVTPKPDTAQAIDAALKLAAEVAAFATLRGLPTGSIAEAQAFPATLGSYAKADLMRLAAWITIDGILPLGPDFVQKIVDLVSKADASALAANPLFQSLGEQLPGASPDAKRSFVVSALSSGATYVREFVSARGITQEAVASRLGAALSASDTAFDLLAVALDATTNYFTHTGLQSVARVLVHDAQESLAAGEVVAPGEPAPSEEGSSWFRSAASVAGVGAVVGAGAMLWNAWSRDDEEDEAEDAPPDQELDALDENTLAAREQAVELKAREVIGGDGSDAEKEALLQQLHRQRRRLRMARRRMRRGGGGRGGRFGGPGRGMGRRRMR